MGYKSRGNWRVGIEFCPKCKKVKDKCVCLNAVYTPLPNATKKQPDQLPDRG